jgi:imidazole glycerol phosphate synthase subunit HisF
MNSIAPFLLPVGILILLVLRKAPKKIVTSNDRPDFIAKASAAIHSDEVSVGNDQAAEGVDYNYDVVGESFQRDHLLALVRSHKAFASGEIYTTALLELEPTNEFDPTAVKVVVEGVQVGYIAKFDSGAVTKMIEKSGKKSYEVPARIGFDAESPAPLIGVKLALTIE